MKNHNEFMKEAADANALPAQTCRALVPEKLKANKGFMMGLTFN